MPPLHIGRDDGAPPTLLCLGAHADDIEIGAGGTILDLVEHHPGMRVHWVVLSATAERAAEARRSAGEFLAGAQPCVEVHDLRDGLFPADYARLKAIVEDLKAVEPDIILTHYRQDAHQDHRTVAEATYSTFRRPLILEYEIPKYDLDLGNPTLFVPLSQRQAQAKVGALMTHFASQQARRWFTPETFYALMRLRGLHAAAPSGFAEAFYGARVSLSFGSARPSEVVAPAPSEFAEFAGGASWGRR